MVARKKIILKIISNILYKEAPKKVLLPIFLALNSVENELFIRVAGAAIFILAVPDYPGYFGLTHQHFVAVLNFSAGCAAFLQK
ncbi:hypothetical protein AAE02nite_25500 [Adhaeribacter aerolatus]|uniref:Uncharacterized protein n=1 Tax=Adhaeribacter aerolatus TaxID=670289 RepID=A0A512AYW9_9BACT|nr:hypothetical protein AAE02nite_25500 [Adhaeribacter aerolatus]